VLPGAHPLREYRVDVVPKTGGETRSITSGYRAWDYLQGLPPGRYRATVTWDGVEQGSVEIEVRAGETTSLVLPLR
jgi:hypothetical protein